MTSLSVGYPQAVVAGTIYALPARACHMFAHGSFTSIDFSNQDTMADVQNVVATEFSNTVSAGFVRFVGGAGFVSLKPVG